MASVELTISERVPTIQIDMSNDEKLELVRRVADTITRCLMESPEVYRGAGGLRRLMATVADVTRWTVAEVYVIALPEAKGLEYSVIQGTVQPA